MAVRKIRFCWHLFSFSWNWLSMVDYLMIYYLMKKQALINFQRIIVLLVLISGSVGVCIFSR